MNAVKVNSAEHACFRGFALFYEDKIMSTRGTISILDTDGEVFEFGRHHDSYPSGLAMDLKEINLDQPLKVAKLMKVLDLETFIDSGPDYKYEIRIADRTIKVINCNWSKEKCQAEALRTGHHVSFVEEVIFDGSIDSFIERADDI